MAAVNYYCEDISFRPSKPIRTTRWLKNSVSNENAQIGEINFIFCSDSYLHKLNLEYLRHDTFTDIVTFPYGDARRLEGDIFISIDRVRENSDRLRIPFEDELHRVMIHGVLHLLGYKDKTKVQKVTMRKKEDAYLSLR